MRDAALRISWGTSAALAAGLACCALWWAFSRREALPAKLVAPIMAAADQDGDGRLSPQEYEVVAPPATPLVYYDWDGNGALDLRELGVMLRATDPTWLVRLPY